MLRFGSIIAWLIVLCLAVCEAQEVRYPKWYASYSGGSINSTDVNDSTVLVSTDSALFLFDKSNGSLQHSIEITDRLIVGASLGSKSSVAWIVTSDGWSVDRVVSVEETDLATGLAIAKYVLPTNGTLGGIITGIRAGLSFSPDSTRLIVNLRYQEAIDRGYDYDYYQGSFWFIIDRTLGRIHRHSMSYLDDVEFAANDTIVLASYSTKSGRGNQSESVVQTSVYSLKDTVLNFIQKMNEKMQLSETKDYIFGRTSVCEWPSLKPLEFNNIVDLSGPLMFSLNGLGYLTKVSDYQTVCEYRDVASDKTLVKFVDSIVRSRAIWKISFLRNALINEGESNRISFWQLNDLPNSSRGLKRRFQDTIVENTATILKKPLIPPIGKPVTLDLSTNADYFSNWIVKTSYVNDCKIIMKAALYDGTNLLDTSQIVVRSLEHDDKAIDFISLGFKYAFVSHISANGRFVSVASKGNIYQAEVGSPFFKYFSGLSQFAVAGGPTSHSIASDNNGELYYTFRYYTGSELSSYHGQTFHVEYFDVDVGKIDSQDKHSKLHTKHTTVGIDHPTEVLTVTNPRWLEGFATYHSMVNDSPYGYFLYAVNSLNGDTVDVEKDLAGVAPYQMDYNYVKKRTLIW